MILAIRFRIIARIRHKMNDRCIEHADTENFYL